MRNLAHRGSAARRATAAVLTALAACFCISACGSKGPVQQTLSAEEARLNWQEGQVPPAPAFGLDHLIDIAPPSAGGGGHAVQASLAPESVSVDPETGIVRYVVVLRGPGAINASYEGIRCATAEYRVYARQVAGQPWRAASHSQWQRMNSPGSHSHPWRLARDGMCVGATLNDSPAAMVRALQSPKGTLYVD